MIEEAIKAQAVAMLSTGATARQVSIATGVHYVTVYRWIDKLRELQLEEEDHRQLSLEYRISEKSDALIEDGLDALVDQPGAAVKHLIPLNAIAGTYRDKIMKRKDSGRAATFGNFVLVTINAQNAEPSVSTIQGSATEISSPVTEIEHSGLRNPDAEIGFTPMNAEQKNRDAESRDAT